MLQPNLHILVQSNNKNSRTVCEICSKLTIEILEQPRWCQFGINSVGFEQRKCWLGGLYILGSLELMNNLAIID